jgi:hypothetical protein
MVLNQFFADCPYQHDDSCPVQSMSLDLNTPRVPKEDFGYVLALALQLFTERVYYIDREISNFYVRDPTNIETS